jgi:hypothetical protein
MWLPAFASDRPARGVIEIRGRGPSQPADVPQPGQFGRFYKKDAADWFPDAHVDVIGCLDNYFDDQAIRKVRQAIQQRRTDGLPSVSLRTLDWLVTNYSKKVFLTCVGADGQRRDLHNTYREALDFYGRPLLDPFRRGPRVVFTLDNIEQETTVGQLNFFRFMLYSGVLDCALANSQAIELDMIQTQAEAKEIRGAGAKRQRVELTPSDPCRTHVVRLGALPAPM